MLAFWGRRQLIKIIPGLRPWEVLSVEQAMDQITYGGEWYREPLGTYTTGPPYIQHWNEDVMVQTCSHFRTNLLSYMSFIYVQLQGSNVDFICLIYHKRFEYL